MQHDILALAAFSQKYSYKHALKTFDKRYILLLLKKIDCFYNFVYNFNLQNITCCNIYLMLLRLL